MITNDDEDGHGSLENGGNNHRYQETDKPQNRWLCFQNLQRFLAKVLQVSFSAELWEDDSLSKILSCFSLQTE